MSADRAIVSVWRVRLAGRVAAVGVVIVWLGLSLGISIGGDTTSAALAIMWVTTIGIGLAAWRWAYVPYIALEPDEVTVQNRLLRYSIPYRDISSVRAGYGGITLVMSDGTRKVAWAVQKSNYARWVDKRTRADELVVQITARLPSADL